jgi:arylsulfatase A-like enzyme
METIDDNVQKHALRFIDEAHKADEPLFVWYNTTAMHFRTHCGQKHKGKEWSGIGTHQDWLATFLAAAGESNIKETLLAGRKSGNKPYKVHIDGFI